jgi:hypothetical protein
MELPFSQFREAEYTLIQLFNLISFTRHLGHLPTEKAVFERAMHTHVGLGQETPNI